jgi:hypothetical protein
MELELGVGTVAAGAYLPGIQGDAVPRVDVYPTDGC